MFGTVLTAAQLTVSEIAICAGAAVLCGLIIALSYKAVGTPSRSFSVTLVILPVIVMMVIMMVNGNLGVGVAVAGSFSLVRFRSLPGKASDIAAVFLAMAAGLACGTGYVAYAVLASLVICAVMAGCSKLGIFAQDASHRYLTITIPEDLDYADAFADIFKKYTYGAALTSMKTVNLGALYELRYEVQLRDSAKEKAMLDAIRTRNGNLTVVSSLMAPLATEL